MKAFRYFTWLLLLAGGGRAATAQTIPNGDLEAWASPSGAPEAPTGWLTTDFILGYYGNVPAGSFLHTGTVAKGAEVHGGRFAAQLSTLRLPANNGATVLHPGWLVLGARPGAYDYAELPNAGAPCPTRPRSSSFTTSSPGRPPTRLRRWCTSRARWAACPPCWVEIFNT